MCFSQTESIIEKYGLFICTSHFWRVAGFCTEAEFLDVIHTKVLKSFPPCYSQSPVQICLDFFHLFKLTQPLTVSTVQLLYTGKEKGGKPDRKPYPLPYGFRNP